MVRSIAEINEKIGRGDAVVLTAQEVCDIAKEIINYSVVSANNTEKYNSWFNKPNYIPYHSESDKAEQIGEQLTNGKISLNQARKEYGLKPIEGGDIITRVLPDSNKALD